ncbi:MULTISPECIES: sporulation initiation factor Spo0A C-terminal domain-containing protein [Eubacteriales]|uniref:Stage 0 sporulation protein A homolog n=1 Tax=Bittarella massiliensis (ex Durand et al. 2017) TaxID=1720313 RepID=A0AAQ1MAZ7_9FIRM|nr:MULTISPECIES: sporulation initiation factor Spo0A C-terminal domain-containing protein [Eubacteriales]ERI98722.1 response regulator receiver domain protein [Clostridium sp. ATCC 29733]MZL68595.1 response regulator [Bittarella massiliensis (ex Durand et al. 2017)]MZL79350.1 response regulator [Bittarella massiliensis (ex Durand et al. 2017)]SHF66275.1 Response regulator receiver domain-containing protein [Bittarella massiliensis (ex Durand et al. 2017)]
MENKTRLMIVEDELEEQNAFVEYLRGQEEIDLVGITGSAAEALKWNGRYRPDVVILDLELGEGEGCGLDLAPALAAPEQPHNPYVIVTTKVTDKSTQAYLHNYVGIIYEKRLQNYGPEQVIGTVKRMGRFLRGRRLRQQSGGPSVMPCPGEEESFEERLLDEIFRELECMGLRRGLMAAQCTAWATLYHYQYKGDGKQLFTKDLYPNVGKQVGCKWHSVEHNIRNAIKIAWMPANFEQTGVRFPHLVKASGAIPTNAQFLDAFVARLRERH